MSYISTAEAARMRGSLSAAASTPRPLPAARLVGQLPVGPALELAVFLATSFGVSLAICTVLAAALTG